MPMACMDLSTVIPEMILAGLALLLVPVAGWAGGTRWRRAPEFLALAGLAAAMVATAPMLRAASHPAFCGTYAVDPFRGFYQLAIEAGAFLTVLVLGSHFHGRPQDVHAPVAVLFATVGGMGLAAALDLGLIALFVQMVSFPSYLLVGLVRSDRRAQEAMLKYFIFAAAALAIMAYGLTFVFGLAGSLNLPTIGLALRGADPVWIVVALALVLVGYGFEITLVPFHFWAPDVFQGANAPAAGFISVVPKIAAFAGLIRFLAEAVPGSISFWPEALAIMAAATMTFGNLVALRQQSLKRLLAYSSIAQAGYVLMGVAVLERAPAAPPAIGFYLAAYLLMNIAAFTVAAQVERQAGDDAIGRFRGLGRRAPWLAAALALALLSLAGIPPLAGFAGKVFLLLAAVDGGMTWLALVAAVNMAVALAYYARVIAELYFRAQDGRPVHAGRPGIGLALGLSIGGLVLLGILPSLGLDLASATRALVR